MADISGISGGWVVTLLLLELIILLFSLSWHEFAHALVASIYGDPTARLSGRLTLNPLAHWDKTGTTLLAVTWIASSLGIPFPVFGWGKPVPVNELNFENPRWDGTVAALAGPMSNLLLAFLLALIHSALTNFTGASWQIFRLGLELGVYLNVFLMFFNLMPLPPLDGARLLRFVLPERWFIALMMNPIWWMAGIFIIVFYLVGYLSTASSSLGNWLLAI